MTIQNKSLRSFCIAGVLAATGLCAPIAIAQQQLPSRVDVSWNRFYDYEEMTQIIHDLVEAYPELLTR